MGQEVVGYRRLFEAVGCFTDNTQAIRRRFQVTNAITAAIHIDTERLLSGIKSTDARIIPVDPAKGGGFEVNPGTKGQRDDRAQLCTEVLAFRTVRVSDTLSQALKAGDEQARKEMEKIAEREQADLINVIDLVAGALGLRIHGQLVYTELNEGIVYLVAGAPNLVLSSPALDVLEPVTLGSIDLTGFQDVILRSGPQANDQWRHHALALRWLTRARSEPDPVIKFVSLFVPLEMILAGHKIVQTEGQVRLGRAIRKIIDKYGGAEKAQLIDFLDKKLQRFSERPSLEERFENYATDTGLPDFESDIRAFAEYNSTRNKIVHEGQIDVRLQLADAKRELPGLEDLAEKYVSFAVFGDDEVYVNARRRVMAEEKAKQQA